MKGIRLWYNANRKSIWKIIGIVAVAIIVLQLVQYIWKQRKMAEGQGIQNTNYTSNVNIPLNSITLQDDKSVISGEKISSGKINFLKTLDTFVDYCNNNKINEAYNLLSEDCKQQMYPKIENFKNSYYNTIFTGKKKNISVENWVGNIYKVKYINDALSSGVYEKENTIQDYITLTIDDKENVKLNINNYIGKQEINKETEAYGIKTKVIEKHTYMDYEIYVFEITNNSDTVVLMNDNNNMDTMYLQDGNELKYNAYTHEIAQASLKIGLKETRHLKIKYYNKYSSNKQIQKVIFSKVILNYNAYENDQNLGNYKEYGTIQINL